VKRVLIMLCLVTSGCVGTYVHVPKKVTVLRCALIYRSEFRVTDKGVESYNGKPDAEAIKAATNISWWARLAALFTGG
jgi:hypothetical protein